jgi:hypothetical protein
MFWISDIFGSNILCSMSYLLYLLDSKFSNGILNLINLAEENTLYEELIGDFMFHLFKRMLKEKKNSKNYAVDFFIETRLN